MINHQTQWENLGARAGGDGSATAAPRVLKTTRTKEAAAAAGLINWPWKGFSFSREGSRINL